MDGAELTPTPTSPEMMMMSSMHSHHVGGGGRPTLGFPLGTALLLIIIFCVSGVFSCCYHWDKLRSLRRRSRNNRMPEQLPVTFSTTTTSAAAGAGAHPHLHLQSSLPLSPTKPTFQPQEIKKEKEQSLPVIMAGDTFPKFMAMPCPCTAAGAGAGAAIASSSSSSSSSSSNGTSSSSSMTVIAVSIMLISSPPSPTSSFN